MAFRIVIGYDGPQGAKAAPDAIDPARQLSGAVLVTYAPTVAPRATQGCP
jgi:hypothetical protein